MPTATVAVNSATNRKVIQSILCDSGMSNLLNEQYS